MQINKVIQRITRAKITINTEEAFDKIHHSFIKILKKLGIEGMYLNIINDIYDKTYS
jgi:hypothetical protein